MAERIPIGAADPKAVHWIRQALDERDRRNGHFRALVLRMLAPKEETQGEENGVWVTRIVRTRDRRQEPSQEDLIAAWKESPDPLPPAIVEFIMKRFVQGLPRKSGSKTPKHSTWQMVMINAFYQHQLLKAKRRAAAGLTTDPAARAKERTVKKFGILKGSLRRIIAPLPLRKSSPK